MGFIYRTFLTAVVSYARWFPMLLFSIFVLLLMGEATIFTLSLFVALHFFFAGAFCMSKDHKKDQLTYFLALAGIVIPILIGLLMKATVLALKLTEISHLPSADFFDRNFHSFLLLLLVGYVHCLYFWIFNRKEKATRLAKQTDTSISTLE